MGKERRRADEGDRIDEIRRLVEEYNQAVEGLYLTEVSLHRIFNGGEELTEQNLPLRLCAVNGLWGANVSPEHMHQIFEKLIGNLVSVNATIAQVRDFDYLNDDVEPLLNAVPRTFSVVYEAVPNHHPAVFAAKFFHWCAPRAFPIIDSNARRAIREFQEINGWQEGQMLPPENGGALNPEHYKNLIRFYKKFIVEMVNEHNGDIEDLIQHDCVTQPAGFQCRNTILRVLDKYFWMKGR